VSKDREEPLDLKQRNKRRTFIMKKRLFSLALASVMALSLAGCGGSSSHRGRDKGRNRADSSRHFCQG
jgi:hypothetical protein